MQLLFKLAEAAELRRKIDDMFNGEHINSTEDRAVLHVATRARRDQVRRGPCMHACPRTLHVLCMGMRGMGGAWRRLLVAHAWL